MEVIDYGFWIVEDVVEKTNDKISPKMSPLTYNMIVKDITFSNYFIYHNGLEVVRITETGNTNYFAFGDPVFATLNRILPYKDDISNQRLLKVLIRAIKRYRNAVQNTPALLKSKYLKRLDALLEDICLQKNMDSY